jgi:putative FmdB family regulatory protein
VPIYEYICPTCGHEEEVLQKMEDKAPDCSKCVEVKQLMKRKISNPAVIFKGSGFYETDYKKKPESKEDKKQESVSPSKKSDGDSES